MKFLRFLFDFAILIACMLLLPFCGAQNVTITGTLQGANGIPAANYTISLTPTQWFFVAGTSVSINSTAYCGTSDDGTVHQFTNPLQATVVTTGFTGTLPASNYYVEYTWYNAAAQETRVSPESTANLGSTGNLTIPPPVSGVPAGASGMKVYIGTTSGGETLQGSTVGTAVFVQSTPLATGANPPATNNTACKVIANDAGWPTGTGYLAALIDTDGNTLPGYPMTWQLLGPNTTIDLSNGLPYYHGVVTYPVPILASPLNHSPQSISGPLSMTGYNLVNVGEIGVGTGLPAWGIDVEGTGNQRIVNAKGGYLVNGAAGTAGQALCSDGVTFNTPCDLMISAFYQTIQAIGVDQTQRAKLNFNDILFNVTDSASPSRTNVSLNKTGNGANAVTATTPGVSGRVAVWDAAGNVGYGAGPPATVSAPITTSTAGTIVGAGGSCDSASFSATGSWYTIGTVYYQTVTGKQQSDCSDSPNNGRESITLPHSCPTAILSWQVSNLAPVLSGDDTHQASQSLVSISTSTVVTQRYRSADHGGSPSSPVITISCY